MRLTLIDREYRLETDSGQSIDLSVPEALELALLGQQLKNQTMLSQQRGQIHPIGTIRISDVILGLNAHHDQVIVRFVDQAYESAYVFSPEVARHMRDGLIQKLGEIEAAKPRRTNQ
jgi:hypothetical protein